MPPRRCLPSPVPTLLLSTGGLKGGSLWLAWASCPGKGLAGAAEAALARVLAGGTCYAYLIFVALVLVVASFVLWLRLLSGFPFLPCLCVAMAGGSDCPCISKGVKRRAPTFVHRQEPPAWALHKRSTLLGQAQNGARAVGAVFYRGHCPVRCASHDLC